MKLRAAVLFSVLSFSSLFAQQQAPAPPIQSARQALTEMLTGGQKAVAKHLTVEVSGLVLAHPGLMIQSEGFTDSTGTLEINQKLSQQRADTVSQFLLGQGLPPDRLTSKGYGPAYPVASNDTREGRSQNRRVELVVSGDLIGTPIGGATTR